MVTGAPGVSMRSALALGVEGVVGERGVEGVVGEGGW